MRIGIDLDDVTRDFTTAWRNAYEDRFGVLVSKEDVTEWDLSHCTHFPNREAFWKWIETEQPRIFHTLEPMPGALEGIARLKADGHIIVIITSQFTWAASSALEWLEQYNVPYDELYVTDDKPKIKCDVYIDDGHHNIVGYWIRTNAIIVRMVQPWNRPMPGVYDVYSWPEFVELVQKISDIKNRDG